MTPREVIASALANPDRDDWSWLGMADAVIDALEKMEVTDKMSRACWENMDGTSWNIWRAMVGAMRDE